MTPRRNRFANLPRGRIVCHVENNRTKWTSEISSHIKEAVDRAKEAGLSEPQLEQRTGIALSTLRRRLAGDLLWTLAEVEAVARALDTTPQELIKPRRPRVKAAS